jgi:hypothetical protein
VVFRFLCALAICLAAIPAPAATHTVPAGGDLQAAIDAAQPGDVILLQSGATYVGTFRLQNKPGNTYITIRTDAAPHLLPAPGERVTPQHAPVLAKLQAPNTSAAALVTAQGAHHWRIELLEIAGVGGGDLVLLGGSASQTQISQMPHDLVFDRVYLHGDPVLGQKRGITANSGTTHIINSHISDIKGVGMDTQAICGWNGAGPFVIENNHLEAAGENIMFGGADPSIWNLVPSDITVRRNLITKPLSWRGEKWSVKNAFELKNARRVLVEGNIIEHVWQASQTGFAVLLTVRNQGGKAPWSVVEDVVIRYNVIRHAGGAFNITGYDDERPSAQSSRIQIAHNVVYDIDSSRWGGSGRFVQIGNQPRDVTIEQNTVQHTGNVLTAYGKPIEGFVFRHNMARHNTYGVTGDGQAPGNGSLQAYFPGARFEHNVLAGGPANNYPAANYFPTVAEFEASFANIAEGDFTLVPNSRFRTSSATGGPLGADLTALATARGLEPQGPSPQPLPAQPSPGAPTAVAPVRRWPTR